VDPLGHAFNIVVGAEVPQLEEQDYGERRGRLEVAESATLEAPTP
jgi:hypothetical protein